jgi:DNA helicase II / ATP-dependent DNA helicase PcrA
MTAPPRRGGAPHLALRGLDDDQRAAVVHPPGRIAVEAGAGSGKTRVLTRRIAHRVLAGEVDPARVLVLTSTRRAAGELRSRLGAVGLREQVGAGTFHAVALAELRRLRADRGRPPPVLLTRRARVVAPLVARMGGAAPPVGAVVRELEWAKASGIAPDDYADAARAERRPLAGMADDVAELYVGYERERRRRGVVDFDDLVAELAHALETDATWRAARRWWWRHLHVDEYQDVTPLQLRVLHGLLGPEGDLFVVGDDRQAIYGFAGARAGTLAAFPHDVPGGVVLRLPTNHRSTAQVVAAGAAVLGVEPPRAPAGDGPPVTVAGFPDPDAEAAAVATAICARHRAGAAWRDHSVLARTNARLQIVARALARAGVPHQVAGADSPLDRADLRAVLDDLRVRAALAPGLALAAHLAGLEHDQELDAGARVGVPGDASAVAVDDPVGEVLALGREYLALVTLRPDLDGLEAHIAAVRPQESGRTRGDVVVLATFHRAKGLEWEHVHIVGVERRLVPLTGGDPDEETRLLHVGITRAETTVALSWTERTADGREAGPSPLLGRLGPLAAPDERLAGPPAGALDAARAALAAGRARAEREPERRGRRRPPDLRPHDAGPAQARVQQLALEATRRI